MNSCSSQVVSDLDAKVGISLWAQAKTLDETWFLDVCY